MYLLEEGASCLPNFPGADSVVSDYVVQSMWDDVYIEGSDPDAAEFTWFP